MKELELQSHKIKLSERDQVQRNEYCIVPLLDPKNQVKPISHVRNQHGGLIFEWIDRVVIGRGLGGASEVLAEFYFLTFMKVT